VSNEQKIKKEIEYWSKHLELDKFNYEAELSALICSLSITITVMIGLIAIIMTSSIGSLGKLIFLLIIGFGFYIFLKCFLFRKHKKNLNQHKLSFFIRERMIQERYEKMYNISKKELNTEFEDLKNICKNPRNFLREHLIQEYYKNKKL